MSRSASGSGTVLRRPAAWPWRASSATRWDARLLAIVGAGVVVSVPYLLALGSPLRLLPDSVTYISLADGATLPPRHQIYPPGYPALLRALGHLSLATTWGFVALNLVLLAAGLGAAYLLCRRQLQLSPMACAIVILATLLCRSVSVFSAVPASEVPYFGLAMLTLLALTLADRQPGWPRRGWVGLGVLLTAAAVSVRYAGLALVPALMFAAVGPANRARLVRTARADRRVGVAMVVGPLIALVAAAVVVTRASPYGREIAYVWRTTGGLGAVADRVATQAWKKAASLGELGSQTNCCRHLSHAFTAGFVVLGLAVAALVVLGWLARRRLGVIELFILGTAAVVVVYSGGVARFWIGAFPFLFAYGLIGAGRLAARWRWTRYGLAAYAAAFVVAGGVWLVNSVELSTATRRFPTLWSWQVKSELQAAYRVAFGQARPRATARAEAAALAILRRYEPLAQGHRS